MIKLSVNKLRAFLLVFVASLNAKSISALQCFECINDPDLPPENAQEGCRKGNIPNHFLVNRTSSRPEFLQYASAVHYVIKNKNMKTTAGPFCLKIMLKEEIARFQMAEAPKTNYLDESGCIAYGDNGRACFCKEEKCNSGCKFDIFPIFIPLVFTFYNLINFIVVQ